MRKHINKALLRMGYKIEKLSRYQLATNLLAHKGVRVSYGESVFDIVVACRMQKKDNRLRFIQVGANDGISHDGLYGLVTKHDWQGIAIEPIPDIYEALKFNYRNHPGVIPLNLAIHANLKSVPLYRVSKEYMNDYPDWAGGIASFDRQHLVRHKIEDKAIVSIDVPCMNINDVAMSHGCADIDLLQVDTEGYDAEIIKMIDFNKLKPAIIKFEYKNLKVEEIADVLVVLSANGYRMWSTEEDVVAASAS